MTYEVKQVDYFDRPGAVGRIYRAAISVAALALLLRKADVRYSPRYQRGFAKSQDDPHAYDVMLPITDPTLQINRKRAEAIAVKLLQGEMGNTEVVWNARLEDDAPKPMYNEKLRELTIGSSITIPDSAHLHLGCYLTDLWKRDPKTIPATVPVDDVPVTREKISEMLKTF